MVLQVLRYSALAVGIFYGFTHQRSITATQKTAAAKREYEHKQSLIEKARAEYAKKSSGFSASSNDGCMLSSTGLPLACHSLDSLMLGNYENGAGS